VSGRRTLKARHDDTAAGRARRQRRETYRLKRAAGQAADLWAALILNKFRPEWGKLAAHLTGITIPQCKCVECTRNGKDVQ